MGSVDNMTEVEEWVRPDKEGTSRAINLLCETLHLNDIRAGAGVVAMWQLIISCCGVKDAHSYEMFEVMINKWMEVLREKVGSRG